MSNPSKDENHASQPDRPIDSTLSSERQPTRAVRSVYIDPIDLIWIHTARKLGMTVVRCPDVYAAWDGVGTLRIGTPETLDSDDSLAQMICHEICHALVAGPAGFCKQDWGLDYEDPKHAIFEQATLLIQARLADQFGLRNFLASTTDFRNYFDRIGIDPLNVDDGALRLLAVDAWSRSQEPPWLNVLHEALRATSEIAKIVERFATPDSLWSSITDV